MSKIRATVSNILNEDELNIVTFDHLGTPLYMMSLDLGKVKVGDTVLLSVKSSNVGVAKDPVGLFSYSNIIDSRVSQLNTGNLLTTIRLEISDQVFIESLITTKSAKRLNLRVDDRVSAFIKASDLSIHKVL